MKPSIHSKLPNAGTTIFTVINSLAAEHNAINLGQGFPDFEMSKELVRLVNKAMEQNYNQYVHMNGLLLLRERIAEKIQKLYQADISPAEEITITPGGTYAIYTALTTILQKGDEVIIFEPAYDSYLPNIEINGAVAVPIPLSFPGYNIDWQKVKEKITPQTKAIIINSPHNPSGNVLAEEDLQELTKITRDTGIIIISDEVYEHLIFDNKKHLSILKYPGLYERSFVCFSFGKVYNCTGWKMGYCIAPPALMKEFRKVHQFNCFTCNSPIQYALAEYLRNREPYLQIGSFLQTKRDFFETGMKETKFKALPSYGSYFQLYSYENITDENEKDFAARLIKEYGVATIPVSAFYKTACENKVLRFCFAKKEETLEQAINKLQKI